MTTIVISNVKLYKLYVYNKNTLKVRNLRGRRPRNSWNLQKVSDLKVFTHQSFLSL